jgi:hypothetical protein
MPKKLVLAALILASPSATAHDENGDYIVYGIGKRTCAEYNNMDTAGHIAVESWIMGYLTGASHENSHGIADMAYGTTPNAIYVATTGRCKKYPAETIAGALEQIVAFVAGWNPEGLPKE